MKDYYIILGVSQNCTEEEIRKKYRKLAMQYHPDRNPDDPVAEDKFKEVAEAYGVLTDPVKKREYDACMASGAPFENGGGFSYSQEDILKDLFRDPRFQHMFTGLLREFQRSGFRHSSTFVKKSFFGGKGGAFIGGIFLVGSMAVPLITGAAKKTLSGKSSFFRSAGNVVGTLMGKGKKNISPSHETKKQQQHNKDLDTTYHTPLTPRELKYGKTVQVIVFGDQGEQTLKVTIPPDSKHGQKLRLRGKGRSGPLGRGDLFLHLVEKAVEE